MQFYILRKLISHEWNRKGYDHKHAYVCSLSAHTIVYKGQLMPQQVRAAICLHLTIARRDYLAYTLPSLFMRQTRGVQRRECLCAGADVLPGPAVTGLHILYDTGALAVLHQHFPLMGPRTAHAHAGPQWCASVTPCFSALPGASEINMYRRQVQM